MNKKIESKDTTKKTIHKVKVFSGITKKVLFRASLMSCVFGVADPTSLVKHYLNKNNDHVEKEAKFSFSFISRAEASIAVGSDSYANGAGSTALGVKAKATGVYSTSIGDTTAAAGQSSSALGNFSAATGIYSTAIGSSSAAVDYATALGQASQATGQSSTALGYLSKSSGTNSVAIGAGSVDSENNTTMTSPVVSFGSGSNGSTSVGPQYRQLINVADVNTSDADYNHEVVNYETMSGYVGGFITANANNTSLAVGPTSSASGYRGTSVGYGSNAAGFNSTSIGTNSTAGSSSSTSAGNGAIAVGYNSSASGQGSIALGTYSNSSSNFGTALGYNAQTNGIGTVSIGSGSVDSENNSAMNNVVSFGSGMNGSTNNGAVQYRQLINMADVNTSDADYAHEAVNYETMQNYMKTAGGGSGSFVTDDTTLNNLGVGYNTTSGTSGNTSDVNNVAVGNSSVAQNGYSTAIGNSSSATGHGSTALGSGSKTTGNGSVALGGNSVAAGLNSVSIGEASIDSQNGTTMSNVVSFGTGMNGSTSLGPQYRQLINVGDVNTGDKDYAHEAVNYGTLQNYVKANANGSAYVSDDTNLNNLRIGYNNTAGAAGNNTDINNVAIGNSSKAYGGDSTAIGQGATAGSGNGVGMSTAVGYNATASGIGAVALGQQSSATGMNAVTFGSKATATKDSGVAIGIVSQSTGVRALAIGVGANAQSDDSVALGTSATTGGTSSVALGNGSKSVGAQSVAIGSGSVDSENNTTMTSPVVSFGAGANGNTYNGPQYRQLINVADVNTKDADYKHEAVNYGTMTGYVGGIINSSAPAIGAGATANSFMGTAIGQTATASGVLSTAVGTQSVASGSSASAFGQLARATGTYSTAIGYFSQAQGQSSTALGQASKAFGTDSVAIGHGSADSENTTTMNNVVSFGRGMNTSTGEGPQYRQLINVGDVNTSDPDYNHEAVNYETMTGYVSNSSLKYLTDDTTNNNISVGNANTLGATKNNIAIGNNSTANGGYSTAIGISSNASGQYGTSLGYVSQATGQGSTAIGNNAISSAVGSTAIGGSSNVVSAATNSVALGTYSIASEANTISVGSGKSGDAYQYRRIQNVGDGTEAHDAVNLEQLQASVASSSGNRYLTDDVANNNVAVGTGNLVSPSGSVTQGNTAIGNNSQATGGTSTAVGYSAQANGQFSTSLGHDAEANGNNSTAIGESTRATGAWTTAVGQYSHATGGWATALGQYSTASGTNSTAIGEYATASGNYATTLGQISTAAGVNSVSLGFGSVDSENNKTMNNVVSFGTGMNGSTTNGMPQYRQLINVADVNTADADYNHEAVNYETMTGYIGNSNLKYLSDDTANNNLSVGYNNTVSSNGSQGNTVVGNGATASGGDATTIGSGSVANGQYSTALGQGAKATNVSTIAVGTSSQASGQYSIALGNNTVSSGQYATALGFGSSASGQYSTSLGYLSRATNASDTAIGDGSVATGVGSTALGNNTTASGNNSVSIGFGSVDSENNNTMNNVVSFGSGMNGSTASGPQYRQLINVANVNTSDADYAHEAVNYGTMQNYVNTVSGNSSGKYITYDTPNTNLSVGVGNSIATPASSQGNNISGQNNTLGIGANNAADLVKTSSSGNNINGSYNSVYANNTNVIGSGTSTTPQSVGSTQYQVSNSSVIGNGNSIGNNGVVDNTVSIGNNNNIGLSEQNVFIGNNITSTRSGYSVAIGDYSSTGGSNDISIGFKANSSNIYGMAIGSFSVASGKWSSAIGYSSSATGDASLAWGRNSSASAVDTIAIGDTSKATALGAIALGGQTNGVNSVTIGTSSLDSENGTTMNNVVSFGYGPNNYNGILAYRQLINVGDVNTSDPDYQHEAVNYGTMQNYVKTDVGISNNATTNNLAVGTNSTAGTANNTTDTKDTALGYGTTAQNGSATAVGNSAQATGSSSVAVGDTSASSGSNSSALGSHATAKGAGSLALGSGSTDSENGNTMNNVVSLGSGMNGSTTNGPQYRQLINVADVNTSDSDYQHEAVNYGTMQNYGNANFVAYTNDSSGNHTGVSLNGTGSAIQLHNVADGTSNNDAVNLEQLTNTVNNSGGKYITYDAMNTNLNVGVGNGITNPTLTQGNNILGQNNKIIGVVGLTQSNNNNVSGSYNTVYASNTNIIGSGTSSSPQLIGTSQYRVTDSNIIGNGNNVGQASEVDSATVIGDNINNVGGYSVSLGNGSSASGFYGTALGNQAIASGYQSTSVGNSSIASGHQSTALGFQSKASGNYSTVLGQQSTASGDYSIASGYQAIASGSSSTAIGGSSLASGVNSTALGVDATASGFQSTALGVGSTASGQESQSFGEFATASGSASISLGQYSNASNFASTALGFKSQALGNYSVAIGGGATDSENGTTMNNVVSFGNGANNIFGYGPKYRQLINVADVNTSDADYAHEAVNYETMANYVGNTSGAKYISYDTANTNLNIGSGNNVTTPTSNQNNNVNGQNNNLGIASYYYNETNNDVESNKASGGNNVMGSNNSVYATNSNIIGSGTASSPQTIGTSSNQVTNSNILGSNNTVANNLPVDSSVIIGNGITANGSDSVVVGQGSTVAGAGSTALGSNVTATGTNSTAVGYASSATNNNSLAFGSGASSTGANSLAVGANSKSTSNSSIAIGPSATSTGNNTVAFGNGSSAGGNNTISIGYNSKTNGNNSISLGSFSNATEDNTVSVGSGNSGDSYQYRRIQNVADGTEAHDAVNLEQLQGVSNNLTSLSNNAVLYQNDANGNHIGVSLNGTGTAIQLHNVANGTSTNDAVNYGQLESVQSSLANANTTASNTYVAYQNDTNGNHTGIMVNPNGSALQIHNVADGTANSDAANLGQVNTAATNAQNNAETSAKNTYLAYDSGNATDGFTSATLNPGKSAIQLHNVANGTATNDAVNYGQLQGVQTELTNATTAASNTYVFYQNDANGNHTGVKFNPNGSAIQLSNIAAATSNDQAVNLGQFNSTLNNDLYNTSLSLGQGSVASGTNAVALGMSSQATGVNSVALGNGSIATSNNTVSVGSGKSGDAYQYRKISNVADGTDAHDVATYGQVQSVENSLNTANASASNTYVAYQNDANGNHTGVKLNPTGGAIQLSNLAAATSSDQAVNLGQLTSTLNNDLYSNTLSLGNSSTATGTNSVALGANSSTTGANSVALGFGSVAGADNIISVGSGKSGDVYQYRRITNVSDGTDAHDAVNLEQLNNVNSTLANNAKNTYVAYDSGNATDGFTGVTFNPGKTAVQLHNVANGTANTDAANVGQVNTAEQQSKDFTTSSVGDLKTYSNDTFVAYQNDGSGNHTGVALNPNGSAIQLHNVADGTSTNDAVNYGQLQGINTTLTNDYNTLSNNAVMYQNDANGNHTGVSLNGTGAAIQLHNVADGTSTNDAVNLGQLTNTVNNSGAKYISFDKNETMYVGQGNVVSDVDNTYVSQLQGIRNKLGVATTRYDQATNANVANTISSSALIVGGDNVAYMNNTSIIGGGNNNRAQNIGTSTNEVTESNIFGSGNNVGTTKPVNDVQLMGNYSDVNANNAVAIGNNISVTGDDGVAVGATSIVSGVYGIAAGYNSTASGAASSAFGSLSVASGSQSSAIGAGSTAKGALSSALGFEANAVGDNAVAVGSQSAANFSSVAVGTISSAGTNGSTAIGTKATVTGLGGDAIGFGATVGGQYGTSLGTNATSTGVNSVSIGSGSVDSQNGTTMNNVVSFGSGANGATTFGPQYRQLINVGDVNTNDADYQHEAVNFGTMQNYTTSNFVAYTNDNSGNHTGVSLNGTGSAIQLHNVADGTSKNDAVNLEQLQGVNSNLTTGLTNLQNTSVLYQNDANGNHTGITVNPNGSALQIHNVANGTASNDAVNYSQLENLSSTVSNSSAFRYYNYDSTTNTLYAGLNNTISSAKNSISIGSGNTINGESSVTVGNTVASNDHSTGIGSNISTAGEDSVAVGYGSSTTGLGSVALGAGAAASNGSVALGNNASSANRNSVALGDGSITSADNVISVGSGNSNDGYQYRRIQNVADGTESHDAVNLEQLTSATNAINSNIAGNSVQYDNDSSGNHTGLTLNSGKSAIQLHNVAAGTADTDAANVKQLNTVDSTLTGNLNTLQGNLTTLSDNALMYQNDANGAHSGVTLNPNGSALQLHNVADGTSANDAVNYSQLSAVSSSLGVLAGNAVVYQNDSSGNHTGVTINPNGAALQMHNVAAGTSDTDAANVGQVNSAAQQSKNYTDQTAASTLNSANQHADTAATNAQNSAVSQSNQYAQQQASQAQSNAENTSKQYTDQSVSNASNSAKSYTDQTAASTLNSANQHADTAAQTAQNNAVSQSQQYTDQSSSNALKAANSYTDQSAANTLKAANAYTDQGLDEARAYTNQTAASTLKTANDYTDKSSQTAQSNAIMASNQYTDQSSANTLKAANNYADQGVTNARTYADTVSGNAERAANTYTDAAAAKTLTAANSYTDKSSEAAITTATQASMKYTDKTALQYDTKNGEQDYSSVTLKGQNGTQIHNLAPGTAPTDAATVSQLSQAKDNYDQEFNNINQQFRNMGQQMRRIKLDSNAGTASAMAVAGLAQASPGHNMFTMAGSSYEGQQGTAFGWSMNTPMNYHTNVIVKLAGTMNTRGHGGVVLGGGIEY